MVFRPKLFLVLPKRNLSESLKNKENSMGDKFLQGIAVAKESFNAMRTFGVTCKLIF